MRSRLRPEAMEERVSLSSRSSWRRFWPAEVLRWVCWVCSDSQSEWAARGEEGEEVAGRAMVDRIMDAGSELDWIRRSRSFLTGAGDAIDRRTETHFPIQNLFLSFLSSNCQLAQIKLRRLWLGVRCVEAERRPES